MVDEFAKFAKLQRRYNKLETELMSKGIFFFIFFFTERILIIIKTLRDIHCRYYHLANASMMYRTKLRLALTYGMKILNVSIQRI